uniref:Uncharacterized protein n=1 Tax=Glossina palpalis gambiensis TaxID=67801 RepID=A0A1B0AZ93_9MUSC
MCMETWKAGNKLYDHNHIAFLSEFHTIYHKNRTEQNRTEQDRTETTRIQLQQQLEQQRKELSPTASFQQKAKSSLSTYIRLHLLFNYTVLRMGVRENRDNKCVDVYCSAIKK